MHRGAANVTGSLISKALDRVARFFVRRPAACPGGNARAAVTLSSYYNHTRGGGRAAAHDENQVARGGERVGRRGGFTPIFEDRSSRAKRAARFPWMVSCAARLPFPTRSAAACLVGLAAALALAGCAADGGAHVATTIPLGQGARLGSLRIDLGYFPPADFTLPVADAPVEVRRALPVGDFKSINLPVSR